MPATAAPASAGEGGRHRAATAPRAERAGRRDPPSDLISARRPRQARPARRRAAISYGGASATARVPPHPPHPLPTPGLHPLPTALATPPSRPLRRSPDGRISLPPTHPQSPRRRRRRAWARARAGRPGRCIGPCQVLGWPTLRPCAHDTTRDSPPVWGTCTGVKTCIQTMSHP